ncbi:MAG: C-terminal binding protein [Gemmataceae bacterium]
MGQRPLVVVTDYLSESNVETPILGDLADIKLLETNDERDVIRDGSRADALLVYHDIKLTERSIAQLDRCRGIIRCGVGFDNVDIAAAGSRGIVVGNVPDYGTEEVADHALLLLLATARRLLPQDQAIRQGIWDTSVGFGAPRLRGRTLGIIGCGRIGSAMALRAKALGMRPVFYDPYKPDGYDKALGIERCYRLNELLAQSEFLSLHCPLTPETHHLVNAATLALLPRGAYLINTARGPCVDLVALAASLESGQVAFAGLDVVEKEPLDYEPIRRHPRVVLTPHTAFYSVEGFREMREKSAQEARRLLNGEPIRNPVNLEVLREPRYLAKQR